MKWRGDVYINTVLPFGLRSAPKIFNSVADSLEWVDQKRGVKEICHYLDNFLVAGKSSSTEGSVAMSTLLCPLKLLGFPVAQKS